ncbi:MAG: hypothetical protein K2R98_30345 [Gemmataceae bacterium]|nr:hypothetical protein [Gemmataceae bacterium]
MLRFHGRLLLAAITGLLFVRLAAAVPLPDQPDEPKKPAPKGMTTATSPDGRLIVKAENGAITAMDAQAQKVIFKIETRGRITAVAFSPDGKSLVSGSDDGTINMFDVQTGKTIRSMRGGDAVVSVACSPDGKQLTVVDSKNVTRVWDLATGQLIKEGKP